MRANSWEEMAQAWGVWGTCAGQMRVKVGTRVGRESDGFFGGVGMNGVVVGPRRAGNSSVQLRRHRRLPQRARVSGDRGRFGGWQA